MIRTFHLSTDSHPSLFQEIDVEYGNLGFGRLTAAEKDRLQRQMRDAKPGDRIPFGKIEILCIDAATRQE